MGHAILQVVFKGRVVQSVPLDRELLTIGRMKDNDLVIDNLSVSRHHARVRVHGDEVSIEDLGSGNGCLVNGIRVERGVITPEDEVFIGKHQLVLLSPESETAVVPGGSGPVAPAAVDSPWDDAHTYFVTPEAQARLVAGPDSGASGTEMDVDLEPDTADDLEDLPEAELEEADELQASGPPDAPEIQLGPEAELGEVDDGHASGPLATPEVHGGLIIQWQGKLDRIVPVDCSPLVLGRAGSCSVLLNGSGVSRRHAQLIRTGDRFEIEDLGSANGTFVNGERVERRELALGDEIGIDEFRMTFVLESRPLAHEIVVAPARPDCPEQSHEDLAQTMWGETVRPGLEVPRARVIEEADPDVAGGGEVHVDPPPSALGEIEDLLASVAHGRGEAGGASDFVVSEPERSAEPVLEIPVEGGDARLGAEVVAATGSSASPEAVEGSSAPASDARGRIHVELELDAEDLPPELVEALHAVDATELRIRATLRLRR